MSSRRALNGEHAMLEWLIVGGGPHGIHMACRLIDRGVSPDRITILDPHAEPLARWKLHTHNTGMLHLRSPRVHNLDVDPLSLERHAETEAFVAAKRELKEESPVCECDFIAPYHRPSLRLFTHHVQSLIDAKALMRPWKSGLAISLQAHEHGYLVHTRTGEQIETKNIVLALGAGDHPKWPQWAIPFKNHNGETNLRHIFAPDFNREQIAETDDVAIVGAGISAAQLALALMEASPNRRIVLVSRHFLKKQDFDSDPGWLGPTLLKSFHREKCYVKRRTMIREARHIGSLAAEVTSRIQEALQKDRTIDLELAKIDAVVHGPTNQKLQLHLHPFELDTTQYEDTGDLVFKFSETVKILEFDTVVLATGFESRRPGGRFLDEAIQNMDLPTAEDGFPIVSRHLSWRKGLFVMGPLAELEVGPASRNLSGARMAADRIVHSREASESAESLASLPTSPSWEMNRRNSSKVRPLLVR
ncbi:MAG: FAD/NAD(P)-binding protein [Acidobacteriota bacterium]